MSLERNIQELHQAVTMLTKSIDLQTATIAEATSELLQAMQGRQTSTVKVEVDAKAAAAELKKTAAEVAEQVKAATESAPVELTDDEVKASPIYKMVQDKMSAHNTAALASNGNDAEAARADTLKILKSYSDDGKVMTFVRTLLEDEEAGEQVLTEMLGMYDTAIAEMQPSSSDFEDGDEEQAYTANDVKAALRAYAKIEGRPAAIMKLQQLTNGKSEVKDIPEDQYAAVIAGLKADM